MVIVGEDRVSEIFRRTNQITRVFTPPLRYCCDPEMNEVTSDNMLSFVTNTLCCEVGTSVSRTMPRVVPDQRSTFENDELFRKLSRECEVSYFTTLSSGSYEVLIGSHMVYLSLLS